VLAAPPPVLKGWGQASDPDGDCRFEERDGKLTIRVPGTLHNLIADSGQVNVPTVLIGVGAVNSSTKPFAAELEGLTVFTSRDVQSR
jgi:hypothetical protein